MQPVPGLRVGLDGVPVEADRLFELGVDYVQGFGIHRPESVFVDLTPDAMLNPSSPRPVQITEGMSKQIMNRKKLTREKLA